MSERLVQALDASRGEIESALREAEQELASLAARRVELERLIRRARAALGEEEPPPGHVTLHDAMAIVLREQPDRQMTVRELAAEINRRRLYRKRDGSLLEASQVHARAKNYSRLFEKSRSVVRLRTEDGE
jgi:HB1, ASXL, restriction endonuclease HTH domain